MERTTKTEELFLFAKKEAKEEGINVEEKFVGGTSDGNIVAAVGLTVLDGLGAIGNGAHAAHEHILVDRIPERVALILRLLIKL
jgi:glutamate carboxypeptidase